MKLRRENITKVLFVTFIIVAFHFALHNSFDHQHDESCAVYVLEELYAGADVIAESVLATFFLAFLFTPTQISLPLLKVENRFRVRAPPLFL